MSALNPTHSLNGSPIGTFTLAGLCTEQGEPHGS